MMGDNSSYSDDIHGSANREPAIQVDAAGPSSSSLSSSGHPDDSSEHLPDRGTYTMRRRSQSHKHGRDRHSARDLLKTLLNEESESTQNRRFLRNVLAKLDTETQRAQEAERRALELAANFKMINEDRRTAKQELDRVNEELRLYKVQYDNAQREILRGREILKDVESQRDDAEVVAARARTEARKLREEKIAYHAREAGRLEGYNEGLQRGLEQARFERSDGERADDDPDEGTIREGVEERESMLEDLPVKNLPSLREGPSIVSPTPQHPIPPLDQQPASRFHEHGIGRTPSPGVQTWPEEHDSPKYIRPPSMPDLPERHVPPDGWIPPIDSHNHIQIPPPSAFERRDLTPRSSPQQLPAPPPGQLQPSRVPPAKGYASSLESVPASIQSTAISSFDIVTNPPEPRLSVIRETSMEYSPDSHSQTLPEPHVFPTPSTHQDGGGWGTREESEGTRTPRSYNSKISLDRISGEYEQRHRSPIYGVAPSNTSQSSLHSRSYPAPTSSATVPPLPTLSVHPPPNTNSPAYPPSTLPPQRDEPDPYMLAPPPPSRPVSATPSRQSSRSRSNRTHTSGSHDDSIRIDVEPPSHSPTTTSPADTPRSTTFGGDMLLSPNRPPPPLPVIPPRAQPRYAPPVPTEPNSPMSVKSPKGIPLPSLYGGMPGPMPGGMPGNMPGPTLGNIGPAPNGRQSAGGSGVIPALHPPSQPMSGSRPGNAPPLGFVPLGPPTPLASSSGLPPTQSTPRAGPANLYSDPRKRPVNPRSPDSSSSFSSDAELPPSLGRHGRSRSEIVQSAEYPVVISPPSSPSSSGKGSRSSKHTGARTTPGSIYQPAGPSAAFNARSANTGAPPSGHYRSLSLNAGSTPGFPPRTLSTTPGPKIRRTPSEASNGSAGSRSSKPGRVYSHYNPSEYVDPSFLASSDNLGANILSPSTAENTRLNAATRSRTEIPSAVRLGSSPALSYVSMR